MKRLVLATLFLCASVPAFSDQLNFMSNSPVRYYTDQDWKLANAATDQALNQGPVGKKIEWNNAKSGSHGYSQAIDSINKKGLSCKHLKIFNYANFQSDQYTFLFCKYPAGWKIPGDGFN